MSNEFEGRVDLGNNRLKHKVGQVLAGVRLGLHYLKLCACCLSDQDLVYLQHCHHLQALQELDLSENHLGRHPQHTLGLLQALAALSPLVILQLEDCRIEEDLWKLLFTQTPSLQHLRFLNLSRNNELTAEPLMTLATQLTQLHNVEAVQASYPLECYVLPYPGQENDAAMDFFNQKLSALIASICRRLQRPTLKLNLK